jgi:hypothetical protein
LPLHNELPTPVAAVTLAGFSDLFSFSRGPHFDLPHSTLFFGTRFYLT